MEQSPELAASTARAASRVYSPAEREDYPGRGPKASFGVRKIQTIRKDDRKMG
jgi:hypothetical protein